MDQESMEDKRLNNTSEDCVNKKYFSHFHLCDAHTGNDNDRKEIISLITAW